MKFQEEKGRFFQNDENGELIAEVTYQEDGVWYLDHTFVHEKLRGQKIGEQLIQVIVEKARAEGKKIVPQCPYAVKVFEQKSEYNDVLASEK